MNPTFLRPFQTRTCSKTTSCPQAVKFLRQPTPDAIHHYKTENVDQAQPHYVESYLETHRGRLLRLADSARCDFFMFPYKAKDVRLLSKIHTSNTATREAGCLNL